MHSDTSDTLSPEVLVLPALVNDDEERPCEQRRWLADRDFTHTKEIPGCPSPLRWTADGVGIFPVGVGKSNAAGSVGALCSADGIDLSDTIFLSVGIAGISPEVGTIGSVMIGDNVVDWDCKFRLDPDESGRSTVLPSRVRDAVIPLPDELHPLMLEAASEAPLIQDDEITEICTRYEGAPAQDHPSVGLGTTVTSDEFWHGTATAADVENFLDEVGAGPLATTQMEEFAVATVLERFGHLARYYSVRAASNFDRPPANGSPREILDEIKDSTAITVGLENAFRVGTVLVDALLDSSRGDSSARTDSP